MATMENIKRTHEKYIPGLQPPTDPVLGKPCRHWFAEYLPTMPIMSKRWLRAHFILFNDTPTRKVCLRACPIVTEEWAQVCAE